MTPLPRDTVTGSFDTTVPALKSTKAERSLHVLAAVGPDPHVLAQLHLLLLGVEDAAVAASRRAAPPWSSVTMRALSCFSSTKFGWRTSWRAALAVTS